MKTVVILSGGMDSVTLLYHLRDLGHRVACISFDYGQKHVKELDCARYHAEKLGLEHKVVDLRFLSDVVESTLLTDGNDVPEGHYEDENMKATVVPNRNMIMASIATAWAVTLKYDAVALGVHAGDHTIYPDCREAFVQALSQTTTLCDYHPVQVIAPFMDMKKTEILRVGMALGVAYQHTWTCYMGGDAPQKSGSSVERAEAFLSLGQKDPLYTDAQWQDMCDYVQTLSSTTT